VRKWKENVSYLSQSHVISKYDKIYCTQGIYSVVQNI
jgi:hypothetical protein